MKIEASSSSYNLPEVLVPVLKIKNWFSIHLSLFARRSSTWSMVCKKTEFCKIAPDLRGISVTSLTGNRSFHSVLIFGTINQNSTNDVMSVADHFIRDHFLLQLSLVSYYFVGTKAHLSKQSFKCPSEVLSKQAVSHWVSCCAQQ